MRPIHCVGIAVMDALSGPLEGYPQPRIRTQVNTAAVRFQPGGGAVNTSGALARMGVPVAAHGKVGADLMGEALLAELVAVGVDVSGFRVSADDATPFTFVGVHADGDRTFIHTPGANLTLSAADLRLDTVPSGALLLYQDLFVLPQLDAEAPSLLAEARRRGITTLLDECWGLGPTRATLEAALPHCDWVVPSCDDLAAIYPGLGPAELADRLRDLGARGVVIKLGPRGCLVVGDGLRQVVPALPARVVDTTGAGDCWDAGFMAGLASGLVPVDAARIGCACAAFCIEAMGGASGVPAYEEVLARAWLEGGPYEGGREAVGA